MKEYKTVKEYLEAFPQWQKELAKLHKILSETRLIEKIKWGAPVYTNKEDKNIVGLNAFNSYVGLWFYQGADLKDKAKILINAQEEKTQNMRQWRFRTLKEIDVNAKLIRAYLKEATENQKAPKEIKPPKKTAPLVMPDELSKALNKNKTTKAQFEKLTQFKQKEYAEFITEAKKDETKQKRIVKILPMIKKGIGLHDKYK